MTTFYLAGLLAFAFALLLTPCCRYLFVRSAVVDYPDGARKRHDRPLPRAGGIAIILAYVGAQAIFLLTPSLNAEIIHENARFILKMMVPFGVIFVTGLIDDLVGLSASQKLAGQALAGVLAYMAGVRALAISGSTVEMLWSLPATVLWLVACTNAFNLMDGADGLAAGLGLCASAAVMASAIIDNNAPLMLVIMPFAGALLGFLRYNFPPASIFLGDSGSLSVGFVLGCCMIMWTCERSTVAGMSVAVIAMSVPLADTGLAILRRYLRRRPILTGDRGHIHHRLEELGLNPRQIILVLYAAGTAAAALAMAQNAVYERYGTAMLLPYAVLAGVGVAALRYPEVRLAVRCVVPGNVRGRLRAQLILSELEQKLSHARTVDDCWSIIRGNYAELGFEEIRLRLADRILTTRNDDSVPAPGWSLLAPISELAEMQLVPANFKDGSALDRRTVEALITALRRQVGTCRDGATDEAGPSAPAVIPRGDRGRDGSAPEVVVIGAGPAGLTAAYELSKHDVRSVVLEQGSIPGGLARTERYKGFLFDIGGHRFFTKVTLVEQMWKEVLGVDFIKRPRLSRIWYNSKFFSYPLEPLNALFGLGIAEAIRCQVSYVKAKLFPQMPEDNFEAWVSNRFGRRLFEIFFKSYTEKVWGIPCNEIGAEWAAQRIRGLSMASVLRNALFPQRSRDRQGVIKTLISEFDYPRKGPGMMWEKTQEIVEARGSRVIFETPVDKIYWEPGRVLGVRAGGRVYRGSHFVSSMPIRQLIEVLDPRPPEDLLRAAGCFRYRDFLTIALVVKGTNLFPDNWIYVHDPSVRVGRIQNYSNWSPEMSPDPGYTCLGLEYFCWEGDDLWTLPDEDLLALGRRELAALGILDVANVTDGAVLRVQKAYPVYDGNYKAGLAAFQRFLAEVPNFQSVGRNGMHRYNNQDHSMLTAVLAARNIMGAHYDLWNVNVDAEYHEEGHALTEREIAAMEATQPLVPERAVAGSFGR